MSQRRRAYGATAGSSPHDAPQASVNDALLQKRVKPEKLDALILVYEKRFVAVSELAKLTGRSVATLRRHYLPRLLQESRLQVLFSERIKHPEQAYGATASSHRTIDPK